MGTLSVVWLIGVSTGPRRAKEPIFLSSRDGVLRILSILASLTAAAALMNFLGFQITLFLLLVFLLRGLGRQSLWLTLVVAVLGSVGVFRLFVGYLDVPLPKTAIRLLAGWGL
jgi:hypothetical protein